LPEILRTLHRRGVRGFVTFNTLIFDHELEAAARAIERIASAGADALIVQDLAGLRLAAEIAPELELHASTQMSITDAAGAHLAARLGVHCVTLARELSLSEIREIARQSPVELEVFVHGALCVAYSGQCFSSEAWGGRSANRGQCAQACRLPYDLVVDGSTATLGDARYLLSPGDLFALHQVPDLVEMGIATLKIEGRYKDAEYVAAATAAYRKAVDEARAGRRADFTAREVADLEQIYSRGLAPHFLAGTNHQTVVSGRAPRHRGVLMGTVTRVLPGEVWIAPSPAHQVSPLKAGDGVVFDSADWRSPEEPEEGGRVYEVRGEGSGIAAGFATGAVDGNRVRPGDLVWRSDDPALAKALRMYTQASAPVARQSVDAAVIARSGESLRIRWTLAKTGLSVTVSSPEPLSDSENRPAALDTVRPQLERLGGTAFQLRILELETDGRSFVPASLLNQLRREAVEKLDALLGAPPSRTVRRSALQPPPNTPAAPSGPVRLHLLVRTPEQLDAALSLAPDSITLDYLDLYGLKPSADRVRRADIHLRAASPRILKPGEERVVDFLLRMDCHLLVRPIGLLEILRQRGVNRLLTGDFSLNAANFVTARQLLDLGLLRLTPTHDLNGAQITALAQVVGGASLEVIGYQHLPVFHTEHCVFCRFLSTGTSYKDCGRPCESHRVELEDRSGRRHAVQADVGCRNTVFGAEAQEASQHLEAWYHAGVRDIRLEFVHESAASVEAITGAFRRFAAGLAGGRRGTGRELEQELHRLAPQGTTQGSLFVPSGHLTLPILQ
jgi:putative protease